MEAALVGELLSKLIDLEQVHEGVSVGVAGKLICLILNLNEIVKEVGRIEQVLLNTCVRNELCEGVRSHITFSSELLLVLLVEETHEDMDAVQLLLSVVAFLDLSKELDARSVVFNDTIYQSKGPSDKKRLTANLGDDLEQRSDELLAFFVLEAVI